MSRDDIIRMALEAGFHDHEGNPPPKSFNDLIAINEYSIGDIVEDFAKLVAAAEREACLAILRDMEGRKWHLAMHCEEIKGVSLHDAYAAIRARGDK